MPSINVKSDVSTPHRIPTDHNSVTPQREFSSLPTGGPLANLPSRTALKQGGAPSATHYVPFKALGRFVGGFDPRLLDQSRHPATISNDQSTKPMSTWQQPPRQMPPPVPARSLPPATRQERGILSSCKSKIREFFGKMRWSSYSARRGGGLAADEGSSDIRRLNNSYYED